METTNPLNTLEDPRHFPGTAVWVLAGLLLFLMAVGWYFGEARPPAGAGVKVAEVIKKPKDFLGRTVTVRGNVETVLGPRAFVLEDEGPGSQMLVVASASGTVPSGTELARANDIRIVGEVRPFDSAKLQSEVGMPASDGRLNQVRDKPVLYAFDVIVPPGKPAQHARSDTP